MSCATSFSLNLIHIHSELKSSVPECGKLIYSYADDPEKCKHKKLKSTKVAQWKNQVVQEKYKKQRCQAQDNIVYSGKKSQETKFMKPDKPPTHIQSVNSSRNKKPKVKLQEDDRNCQENRRPKKPRTHMRSVINTDNMQIPKPVARRLCKDRYCQSTRCFKKATKGLKTKVPERPRCGDDKNCQSPQFMRSEKSNNAMQLKQPAVNTRKMQPIKRPVEKLSPRCHKYHQSTSTEKNQKC